MLINLDFHFVFTVQGTLWKLNVIPLERLPGKQACIED